MPLGAARLNFLARSVVIVAAEVIRKKKGVTAIGNAQVDTAQSKFGGASALFDGTGDYLDLSTSSNLTLPINADFTIECWIRPSATTGIQVIATNRNGSLTGTTWDISLWNGSYIGTRTATLLFETGSGAGSIIVISDNNVFTANTFYHIAVVRSSNEITLYVNGVDETNSRAGTRSAAIGSAGNLSIGMNPGDAVNTFAGHVDEFRWSNTARYTAAFTAPTAAFVNDENTLLLLHMDGTDAATVFEDDNGVRAKKGITATIGTSAGNSTQIDTAQSQFGGASALFDGSGDRLQIYNQQIYLSGNFTIEFWFRGGNQTGHLIGNSGDANLVGNNRLSIFFVPGSNKLDLYMGPAPGISTNTTISTLTWYHIAIVRISNVAKIYVDGTEQTATKTHSLAIGNVFHDEWKIGTDRAGGDPYLGYIDEVRISNTARYTATFTPSTTPFVNDANTLLLLHMNGTDASTFFEDDNGVRSKVGVTAIGNAQVDTAQSQFGGASALFDGTGDYLEAQGVTWNDFFDDDVATLTIEGWFRFADTGTRRILFGNRNDFSTTNGLAVEWNATTAGKFRIYSNTFSTESTNAFSINTFYHIALTRNLGSCKLYINGVEECSATLGYLDNTNNNKFFVGWSGFAGQNPHNGYIDEFRISNIVRYTAAFTAPTAPFVNDANTLLLLHMDGTDGSVVFTDDNS